jgi:isoamylase
MKNWELAEGSPNLSGSVWDQETRSYNFTLFSKEANKVTLLIYNAEDFINPIYRFDFDPLLNKSHHIWHCRIPANKIPRAKYYGYRVEGIWDPSSGKRFDYDKILLDPFSLGVFFPPAFNRIAACLPGKNDGKAPLALLPLQSDQFDWEKDPRPRHGYDAIIYEMHIGAFTKRSNSGVKEINRGTFLGVIEKIPYLKELGITVVELLPVFQSDPQDEDSFWGYMPLSFFSPRWDFAATEEMDKLKNEFKYMIKALHEADIEVILDVVYNHTVESGESGPTYSFRGIDNSSYYLLSPDMGKYLNDSGTGNVLRCAHPYVRKLIMESLRYWAHEMHVDGFRFDLASIFARNNDGSLNQEDPPIISEISSDPELSGLRLIGEVWDLSAMLLGKKFPGITWMQWNGRFRDDIRSFVKGDEGKVPALMTRIYGSTDLFPDGIKDSYRPFQSVNYITCHDGFCLNDLVSYNEKHNEGNGYNNQDGSNENLSWNCGWEGNMNVPEEVIRLRKKQVRNFCTLLLLSNGIPMFYAGDEFMNTQQGNNNPVNQDNEITWLDWDLLSRNSDIFRFFKMMIAFRKSHLSISRSQFWREDIHWYGTLRKEVDLSSNSHCLAFCLHSKLESDNDIYVMINAYWEEVEFIIHEGKPEDWFRVVDTGLNSPDEFKEAGNEIQITGNSYLLKDRSIAFFIKK